MLNHEIAQLIKQKMIQAGHTSKNAAELRCNYYFHEDTLCSGDDFYLITRLGGMSISHLDVDPDLYPQVDTYSNVTIDEENRDITPRQLLIKILNEYA